MSIMEWTTIDDVKLQGMSVDESLSICHLYQGHLH